MREDSAPIAATTKGEKAKSPMKAKSAVKVNAARRPIAANHINNQPFGLISGPTQPICHCDPGTMVRRHFHEDSVELQRIQQAQPGI